MKAIPAAELEALLETDRPIEILDLRSRSDFQNGHLDGAHSLPAPEISPATILLSRQLLPTEPVYLVSQSGALARLTACDLERHGLEKVPMGWLLGTASPTNIDALLESVGVQIGRAGTEFTHSNVVIFLNREMRIAKGIYGTGYSSADVNLALQVAGGQSDWIGRHSDVLYAILLFGASILCVALICYLREFKHLSRSSRRDLMVGT